MNSIAKTKKGNFNVEFVIFPATVVDFKVNATVTINNKFFEVKNINLNFSDRIDITSDIANELGVKYDDRMKLQCDISKVVKEVSRLRKEKRESGFNGKMIDSGYGFMMKNTKKNHDLVNRYGLDAIEKI